MLALIMALLFGTAPGIPTQQTDQVCQSQISDGTENQDCFPIDGVSPIDPSRPPYAPIFRPIRP